MGHNTAHRKNKKRRTKRGGFKLINPALRGFQPVFQMMQSPSSRLSILTTSSLKGYILKLDVSPEYSLYKELNRAGSRFGDTITSFILKYVGITPIADMDLPDYLTTEKSSESAASFLTEANLQQMVWLRSIDGGKQAICPPVGNCFLFENASSLNMCNYVQQSSFAKKTKDLFQYFRNVLSNPQIGLGIFMMPMITNSFTFYDFLQMNPPSIPFQASMPYFQVAASIVAQLVRLFLDIKMIHLDLHAGNSLVSIDGRTTWLIDFGRVSNLISGVNDEFLSVTEKEVVMGHISAILQDRDNVMYPKRSMPANDREKNQLKFITKTVEYLKLLDKNINARYFGNPTFQLKWIEDVKDILEPAQYTLFLKNVYEKYYSFITVDVSAVPRISNATIRRSINTGALVTNNFTEQTSIATFP